MSAAPVIELEAAVRDEWQVVAALSDLPAGVVRESALLGMPIGFLRHAAGTVEAWRRPGGERLHVIERFGYAWTTLGAPAHDLFAIPECAEADRRLVHAGSFAVRTSGPRVIENFLDLGHFPFVHRAYLGIEPYTEVKDYQVEVDADSQELVARRCRFYQPLAALTAREGFEVEYLYRVPHPYCAVLYKSCPIDPVRSDVIALFARPVDPEHVVASLFLAILDDTHTDLELRQFQQVIFAQDKPVLENQRPRRLPLDPRAEISVRADRSSVAYRRWLQERGVRYGTIPLDSPQPPVTASSEAPAA